MEQAMTERGQYPGKKANVGNKRDDETKDQSSKPVNRLECI